MTFILMKLYKSILTFLILLAVLLFSCIKPREYPTPPPLPHDDPFQNYTRVESNFISFPEVTGFGDIAPFVIDSNIYVFSKWVNITDIKLAIISLSGDLTLLKTIYTSGDNMSENKIIFDQDRNLFYIVGSVNNEEPFAYSNPLFLVFDMQGNLISENIYAWDGRHNGFSNVVAHPGNDVVLLAYDEIGSIGENGKYEHSMIFLNNSLDSVKSIHVQIDSASITYFNNLTDSTFQFLGTKIDSLTAWGSSYDHTFYAEMNSSGELLQMNWLFQSTYCYYCDIYIEDSDPQNIYQWDDYEGNMTLKKISESGSLYYSRNIELTYGNKVIDHEIKMQKETGDDKILIYGYFAKSNLPDEPTFYGNYIIKTDDSGNEDYRILFNEDLAGYNHFYPDYPPLFVLGEDHYLLLFTFCIKGQSSCSLCLSEVKLN
jgi:hypothetical protein